MKKHRIIFYGDTNTFGYDPRGMLGMRYPEPVRWTTKVRESLGDTYDIVEEGLNGRVLPDLTRQSGFLRNLTSRLTAEDYFIIMLGTNDILLTDHPDADLAVEKMQALLQWLNTSPRQFRVIVIAPVPVDLPGSDLRIYYEQSILMNFGFQMAAAKEGALFLDASVWDVDLSYDGVHFSEAGHDAFAKGFISSFKEVI